MNSFAATSDVVILSGYGRRLRVRPLLIHASAVILLAFALMHAVAGFSFDAAQSTPLPQVKLTSSSHRAAPKSNSVAQSGAATTPIPTVPAKSAAIIPATPTCVADSYSGPSALDVSGSQPGVTQVVDATHYYQIYGYTADQARQQITQCAPRLSDNGNDFTGYTSYRLSWLYNYGDNGSGQCTLSNIKVGMHISKVLPSLQLSQYANSAFAAQWQLFAPALDTHEQGHVTLDEQYAAKILTDLQNVPATDCATISQVASTLINSDVTLLNQANVNYDTQTNHGATQGAILP